MFEPCLFPRGFLPSRPHRLLPRTEHAWGAHSLECEVGPRLARLPGAPAFWTISSAALITPDIDVALQKQMLPVRLNAKMCNVHILESLIRPQLSALSRSSFNLLLLISEDVVKFAPLQVHTCQP